jgi:hypothetical protein
VWWFVWGSLAVAVIVPAVAGGRAGIAALRLWRDVKRTQRGIFDGLDRAADKAEAVADKAEALAGSSERISRSHERLARSRRRLAVLQAAWDEATDALGAVTAYYPRK